MAEAVIDAGKLLEERDRKRAQEKSAEDEAEKVEGERGAADLKAGRKGTARGARAFVAVIAAVGVLFAIFITMKAYHLSKQETDRAAKPSGRVEKKVRGLKLDARAAPEPGGGPGSPPVVQASIAGFEGLSKRRSEPQVSPAAGAEPGPSPALPAPPPPAGFGGVPQMEGVPQGESVQGRRLSRGFGGATGEEGGLAATPPSGPEPAPPTTAAKAGGFEEKLEPTELRATSATLMKDRDYWLTQGATLDCVLQTKIVSTVPGMVSCFLTRNVYSTNGRVVLLDRGSKLVGRYQGGVQQGETRIFVAWTRAETPNGVVVNLDSPGTGSLGEAGVGGWADTHFWDRFGAAIMVSLIQSGSNAAAARIAGPTRGTSVSLQAPVSATNEVIEKTYENTVNMPPTISVNQGERISIFVARDLNFRSVYGLEPAHHGEW